MENLITIKCPKCGHSASKEEWEEATNEEYNENDKYSITKLFEETWKSCFFTCPSCKEDALGKEFL